MALVAQVLSGPDVGFDASGVPPTFIPGTPGGGIAMGEVRFAGDNVPNDGVSYIGTAIVPTNTLLNERLTEFPISMKTLESLAVLKINEYSLKNFGRKPDRIYFLSIATEH